MPLARSLSRASANDIAPLSHSTSTPVMKMTLPSCLKLPLSLGNVPNLASLPSNLLVFGRHRGGVHDPPVKPLDVGFLIGQIGGGDVAKHGQSKWNAHHPLQSVGSCGEVFRTPHRPGALVKPPLSDTWSHGAAVMATSP
jgi:hypothetical protein